MPVFKGGRGRSNVGQRGGSAALPEQSAGAPWTAWQQLAAFSIPEAEEPQPLVLQVALEVTDPSFGALEWRGVAGLNTGPGSTIALDNLGAFSADLPEAQLQVVYGCNGVLSTRILDVRNGTYQLPMCHTATVRVRSRVGEGAFVSASLAPGQYTKPDEPTRTGRSASFAGGGTASLWAPAGVVGWRIGVLPGAPFIPFDCQLQIVGAQPNVLVDFSVPSYSPQIPDLVDMGFPTFPFITVTGADAVSLVVEAAMRF